MAQILVSRMRERSPFVPGQMEGANSASAFECRPGRLGTIKASLLLHAGQSLHAQRSSISTGSGTIATARPGIGKLIHVHRRCTQFEGDATSNTYHPCSDEKDPLFQVPSLLVQNGTEWKICNGCTKMLPAVLEVLAWGCVCDIVKEHKLY